MSRIKFNGPIKCNRIVDIQSDIIMLSQLKNECKNNRLPGRKLLDQLPNTVSVSFHHIQAYKLITALGDKVKGCN